MQPTHKPFKGNLVRTVDLYRRAGGFGFTLSSQGPCVLSCIIAGSPAHRAGLKPGDEIIEVNGASVENAPHEQVVKLIARSPDGMVQLGVRNRSELLRFRMNETKINTQNQDETVINETILNRVDKVVEELKSGQLFGDSPSLNSSLSNGKFITEDDIVTDEELNASFCESIRSENSVPGSSPAQSYASSRRSSEGDVASNSSSSPMLSRLLYPKMTPLKGCDQADIDLEPELRSIVGYLGSIELPVASSLPAASLTAIRNCVRRLRAQQKVHVFFLMEVSLIGIKLVDNEKRAIVTYPIKCLAFTGLCSDDKRVFGIVTRKTNEPSADKFNNVQNNHKIDIQSTVNCSCHVFSVNPELNSHQAHQHLADKYGIQCTEDAEGGCVEFPASSSPILKAITGMFKERSGSESGGTSSDGERRGRSLSLSSSHSESDGVFRQPYNDENSTSEPQTVEFVDSHMVNGLLPDFDSYKMQEQTAQNDSKPLKRVDQRGLHEAVTSFNEPFKITERNDSGVCSDSFPEAMNNVSTSQGINMSRPAPPVVSVSSFHSRESSADSQMSLGSHHSSLAGTLTEVGIASKSQHSSQIGPVGMKDLSLSNSQESLAHSDIVVGTSSSRKTLNASASISSSTLSIHSLSSMPGDMSQVDGRVGRWALGFDKLMEDPAGLGCFKEFLKKEFSDENIVFWIACENFRSITDFEELKMEAESIFHNHLTANAPLPVNIDSNAVRDAEEQLQNPNNDMFRLQQQQVYTLMKFDSYPRFLKSDVYRQSLVAEIEGGHLPCQDGEEERGMKGRGSFFWKRSGRSWGSKHSSKRSSSGIDGDKKKSILPWKGKRVKKGDRSFGSQPGSARSSLSSLSDSVPRISYSTESLHVDQRRESESFQFCRVVLPDHSSTILLCKEGQTLRQALMQLCERRHLSLVAHEVFLGGGDKLILLEELDEDMSIMGGREVVLIHRTLFRLELPDGVILCVKVKPDQSVKACLEPILYRQGFSPTHVITHLVECEVPLDLGIPAASIEHQLVVVETEEQLTGNINAQSPPRQVLSARASRRESKKNAFDDLAFEEVMRGKRQALGDGHFDQLGVWVPESTPSEDSLKEDLNRGDGSFGKSLLKAQGLFARKRREGSEQEKIVTVVSKSGRFGNEKTSDVKADFFDLISRAQANRMDDQRGELKGNLELPDFLKIPASNKLAQGNEDFKVPYPPQPPHGFRTKERNVSKPVLKKTLSSPIDCPAEKMDLMQELAAKFSKKTEPTKKNPSPRVDQETEPSEILLDFNFNSRPQPQQAQNSQLAAHSEDKQKGTPRPRSCTDSNLYTMEVTPHGIRHETDNRPQPVTDAEPRKSVAHVPPSIRPQASQPVTVNSLRGMHYATNPRRNTVDQVMHFPSTGSVKPPAIGRVSSKSSQNIRDVAPAIYDMRPEPNNEGVRLKGYDNSAKYSSTPRDIPQRKLVSAYSLPEVNSQRAEVHIPSEGGPPPVPRRTVSSMDRRPRPKPIHNPKELLARLENAPVSSTERVESPPNPNISRVGSPPPPPPTPPSGSLLDLQIADFSPPPSICDSPEKTSRPLEDRDTKRSSQPSGSQNNYSPNRTSSESFAGPVAYVEMPGKDSQRTLNYIKQPITPNVRVSNLNASNSTNLSQRLLSENRVDAITQASTPGSVTPTVSNLNKTVTSSPANERTLVEESPSENVTPYAGQRPSMDSASKRLITNTGSVPRTKSTDLERRKSRQGSEIPQLDPYVTYEKEDLRITFV
ncbi:regulator of G-protein signaling 12-like isoform X3 [Stylophora pistillata]|uniref:regulator of G-protein signaling 12-like isoform X3 n=1 Tax=Stylophora pistillata TaxID=50429 RepID=UPI000C0516CB|nr:regulator of G-protein signaling 12-like isoform X3 [Stylophora pistillata]